MSKEEDASAAESLLTAILGQIQEQTSANSASNKSVLVIGDKATGKTTLIDKLHGVKDAKKGMGLEYAYIDVKDELQGYEKRLSVWVMDGDPGHINLLQHALNAANYAHTLVILTVSMATPWSWLEELNRWIELLSDHIESLELTAAEKLEARQRLISKWQKYNELGNDPTSSNKRSTINGSIGDNVLLPLTEGAFETNLGLDIIVVVTMTDYMATLKKDFAYRDEHFDFIQQWIRRFCLQHGAALFYTSAKADKNCDLLYKYLLHRIYGQPFQTPAMVLEKDAVVIPAGWDSLSKISIIYERMQKWNAEDYYEDIIRAPPTRKPVFDDQIEIECGDEQNILVQQLENMELDVQERAELPLSTVPSEKQQLPLQSDAAGESSAKKVDAKPNTTTSCAGGTLAKFCNSFWRKGSGSRDSSTGNMSTANGSSDGKKTSDNAKESREQN